jgi:hypothetical protein
MLDAAESVTLTHVNAKGGQVMSMYAYHDIYETDATGLTAYQKRRRLSGSKTIGQRLQDGAKRQLYSGAGYKSGSSHAHLGAKSARAHHFTPRR